MRRLLTIAAAFMALLGFTVMLAPGWVLTTATHITLPQVAAPDSPAWIALAFARLAAGALLTCAVLLAVLSGVMPVAAERRVAWGTAIGMALLAAIAAAQAQALLDTPASWVLAGGAALFALGFATVGLRPRVV